MIAEDAPAPNAKRLLAAGFMAIMASGVGFSIRAGILDQWAEQYGFTQTELGAITGGGLTGFGIIILLSALIADKIGYGALMVTAFVMHVISAAADAGDEAGIRGGGESRRPSSACSGGCSSSPSATGSPRRSSTRWSRRSSRPRQDPLPEHPPRRLAGRPGRGRPALDRLHRRGHLRLASRSRKPVPWQYQISLFLVPVALYGLMMLGQRFPRSEASQQGVSYRNMLRELGMLGGAIICVLLGLFFHSDLQLADRRVDRPRWGGLAGFSYVDRLPRSARSCWRSCW